MRRSLLLPVLLIFLAALFSIGCSSNDPPVQPQTIPQLDQARKEGVILSLKTDGELAGERITVTAVGDTVTLDGTVQNADEKERAEKLAKSVKGVNIVKNNLTVLSSSPAP